MNLNGLDPFKVKLLLNSSLIPPAVNQRGPNKGRWRPHGDGSLVHAVDVILKFKIGDSSDLKVSIVLIIIGGFEMGCRQ